MRNKRRYYRLLVLFATLLLFTRCEKEKNEKAMACGINDPINNISWLKAKVNLFTGGREMNAVILFEYNGKEVIEVSQSVSSALPYQYYCNGEQLMFSDYNAYNDYKASRKKVAVLYGTFWGL